MAGLLKFITCGSVDDGKSTLIGHILYDAKLLYADQKEALVLDSKVGSRGGEIDYSLLLDGLMAEREQGITIDVAYRYFTTDNRSFIVADTPGHEEYTRNMAVGASFAQLAVILTDATQGVLVQTRRHARICKLMGIKYFVFAVNKMDLAGYSAHAFEKIKTQIEELSHALGLFSVVIIPVSATAGDNVTKKSDNMPWYTGPTLLHYLEHVEIDENVGSHDFVMPVQRVCRPDRQFRGFQGQIENGSVHINDPVKILPSNETATVKSIIVSGEERDVGIAGQAVTVQLSKEVDVSRGCVFVSAGAAVSTTKAVGSEMLWLDDTPLTAGKEYLLKLATKRAFATVKQINYKVDVNTGAHIKTQEILKNEIANCTITFSEDVVADLFENSKALGGFILIDRITHQTAACGVVRDLLSTSNTEPYFVKDVIAARGVVFEEFYFNLENAFVKKQDSDKSYTVGDSVAVQGDSFKYPSDFDILIPEDDAAVLIRQERVDAILRLQDYAFSFMPKVDSRGFALQIHTEADMQAFLQDYANAPKDKKAQVFNKWARFEAYRRIVCNDNFWVI